MNIFNSVSAKIPKRNKFNLNHQVKLTGEMGTLMPIFCEPTLPGDRFKLASSQLIRFAPLVAPIMSDIDCYVHFFFVPNRIIWKEWETFITASKNGKKLSEDQVPVPPRLRIPNNLIGHNLSYQGQAEFIATDGSLMDYLGFPTMHKGENASSDMYVDELPLRAYQRIFFDWYRDENLSSFDDFSFIDDDDFNNGDNEIQGYESRALLLMKLQRRAWKKDYFTSALPFAQKGDDVLIPMEGINSVNPSSLFSYDKGFKYNDGDVILAQNVNDTNKTTGLGTGDLNSLLSLNSESLNIDSGTIRDLRRAFAAQKFLEREAVGGTRYIEQILAFFGVKSSDARLQRSEFLGGSKQPVVVSQVLQTSQTTTDGDNPSPLGQPAGNAVSAGGKYIFDRTFEEHGFIIGILSVIPKAEYMNGMPKKYLKRDRFDYYWPQFARIGEQPIQRQEVNYSFVDDLMGYTNEQTFGYTPRYAEYRFINSHVHGDFKDSLLFWTLVRDYGKTVPFLNESFIECKPSNRIFAYDDSQDSTQYNHLWIQVGFNVSALRPLPKYGESV